MEQAMEQAQSAPALPARKDDTKNGKARSLSASLTRDLSDPFQTHPREKRAITKG